MIFIAHISDINDSDKMLISIHYSCIKKNLYLGTVLSSEKVILNDVEGEMFFCLKNNKVYLTYTLIRQCSKITMTSLWNIEYFSPLNRQKLMLFKNCLYWDFKYIILSFLGYYNSHIIEIYDNKYLKYAHH